MRLSKQLVPPTAGSSPPGDARNELEPLTGLAIDTAIYGCAVGGKLLGLLRAGPLSFVGHFKHDQFFVVQAVVNLT